MFTGIIETTAQVISLDRNKTGAHLILQAPDKCAPAVGDSLSINGCCLTLSDLRNGRLTFDLLQETLDRTNLGDLVPGSCVNLEPALSASGRMGGHFVQGHVDCVSAVKSAAKTAADHRLEVDLPCEFARYVVFKGSIAINGVSLTIAKLEAATFTVCIIPHTLEMTNLRFLNPGDLVNLEFDILAKYVERLLQT
jgi:riboflavin synthase